MHVELLTLTAKIFLFLQVEVAFLTGVAGTSTRVGLAVTLPTFLDKTHGSVMNRAVKAALTLSGESQLDEQMCITNNDEILTC